MDLTLLSHLKHLIYFLYSPYRTRANILITIKTRNISYFSSIFKFWISFFFFSLLFFFFFLWIRYSYGDLCTFLVHVLNWNFHHLSFHLYASSSLRNKREKKTFCAIIYSCPIIKRPQSIAQIQYKLRIATLNMWRNH